jgi:hypothetical protein
VSGLATRIFRDARLTEAEPSTLEFRPTDVFDEFRDEHATHEGRGYTAEHDAEHGIEHLAQEIVERLTHPGELSSPAAMRHVLIQVGSLAGAAVKTLDGTAPAA